MTADDNSDKGVRRERPRASTTNNEESRYDYKSALRIRGREQAPSAL